MKSIFKLILGFLLTFFLCAGGGLLGGHYIEGSAAILTAIIGMVLGIYITVFVIFKE